MNENEMNISIEEYDETENTEDLEVTEYVDGDANDEFEELTDEDMEELAGGTGFSKDPKDLYHYKGNFIKKKVHGVKNMGPTSCLTLRLTPGGQVMYGHGWQNGQYILVNKYLRTHENNWAFVYSSKKGGAFGYADKRYF